MDLSTTVLHNCIVVDWLSVVCNTSGIGFDHMVKILGLESAHWIHKEGSFRNYGKRAEWGKITIHYTPVHYESFPDTNFNSGCLMELSGQGCREFESFGRGDWALLITGFRELRKSGIDVRFTRLDIAYDDFTGVLPIEQIAMQAQRLEFTAKPPKCSVTYSTDKHDIEHVGQCIVHGSRSSNTLIRIYNKRVERQRYDLAHWVRAEIQMRKDSAEKFLDLACSGNYEGLGDIYSGVIRQYVQYRDKTEDANAARWPISSWYSEWLGDVAGISLWEKKDVEYNKSRMDRYAYKQNCNHTISEIEMDGITDYLQNLYIAAYTANQGTELPDKYKAVIASTPAPNAEAFARSGFQLPPTFAEWLALIRDSIDNDLQIYTIPPPQTENE